VQAAATREDEKGDITCTPWLFTPCAFIMPLAPVVQIVQKSISSPDTFELRRHHFAQPALTKDEGFEKCVQNSQKEIIYLLRGLKLLEGSHRFQRLKVIGSV
jgi:hypothetical protein